MILKYNITSKQKTAICLAVLFKVTLGGLFSSDFVHKIFVPFIEIGLKGNYNPWNYVYSNNLDALFPYPGLMALILAPFTYASSLFGHSTFLGNVVFKLPLVLADLYIFWVLLRLRPRQFKLVFLFYFMSPVILFSTYMHSQLDIIPTALVLGSILLAINEKLAWSFLVFGLAMATKTHTLIIFPFLVIFLTKLKRVDWVKKWHILILPLSVFALFSLPFMESKGFMEIVFRNREQNLLYETFLGIMDLKLYLAPLLFVLVFARFASSKKINTDLLLGYIGIVFSMFVILVYPNPGWFIWSTPFISLFYVTTYKKNPLSLPLFLIFNLSFLSFFLFFYQHPYTGFRTLTFLDQGINFGLDGPPILKNVIFTVLTGLNILNVYLLHNYGIKASFLYQRKFKSILIGIGGDSASGKSTLLGSIKGLLGDRNVLLLEGDGDHKWERGHENWNTQTHLNPKSNHLHKQADHLRELKMGLPVWRSDYDHGTGKFLSPQKIRPLDYIVISGLHPFYLPKSRFLIDFKVFLNTEERLRQEWKINRDVLERGHSNEKVLEQIKDREIDSQKYIAPQRNYANMVVRYYKSDGIDSSVSALGVEIEADSNIDLTTILDLVSHSETARCRHDYSDNLKKQTFWFEGKMSVEAIKNISTHYFNDISDFLCNGIDWEEDCKGMVQLVFLIALGHQVKAHYEV